MTKSLSRDDILHGRWRLPVEITAGEVVVYAVYGSRAAVRVGGHDLVVDVASLVEVSTVDDETYELHRRLVRPQADDGE